MTTTTTTTTTTFACDEETRRANERAMRAWRAETSESLATHARERARASAEAHARAVREAREEFIEALRRRRDRRIATRGTSARDGDDDDDDGEDDDASSTKTTTGAARRRPADATNRTSPFTSIFPPSPLFRPSTTRVTATTRPSTPPSSRTPPRSAFASSARDRRRSPRAPFFAHDVDDDHLLTAVADMCRKADALRVDVARSPASRSRRPSSPASSPRASVAGRRTRGA